MVWNDEEQEWNPTGVNAQGPAGPQGEPGPQGQSPDLNNVVKLDVYKASTGTISPSINGTANVTSGGNASGLTRGQLYIDSSDRLGVVESVSSDGNTKTVRTIAVPTKSSLAISINGDFSKSSSIFYGNSGNQEINLSINSLDFGDPYEPESEVQKVNITQNNQSVQVRDNASMVVLNVPTATAYSGTNLYVNGPGRYRMFMVLLDSNSQGSLNTTKIGIGSSMPSVTLNIATNQSALVAQAGLRLSYQQMNAS